MNTERIRADFDAIARLTDGADAGPDRYDAFVLAAVPPGASHVLEVGCGLGRLAVRLAQPHRRVVAVDLSPGMIARAQARLPSSCRVEFICGDFLDLAFDADGFDCILTSAALHHMPVDAALPGMRRLLRPGGRLIIHDLRRTVGLVDAVSALMFLTYENARRMLTARRPLRSRELRRAWSRHGAGETYLTFDEACALAQRFLPGARCHSHRAWRYSVIWDRPPADAGAV